MMESTIKKKIKSENDNKEVDNVEYNFESKDDDQSDSSEWAEYNKEAV